MNSCHRTAFFHPSNMCTITPALFITRPNTQNTAGTKSPQQNPLDESNRPLKDFGQSFAVMFDFILHFLCQILNVVLTSISKGVLIPKHHFFDKVLDQCWDRRPSEVKVLCDQQAGGKHVLLLTRVATLLHSSCSTLLSSFDSSLRYSTLPYSLWSTHFSVLYSILPTLSSLCIGSRSIKLSLNIFFDSNFPWGNSFQTWQYRKIMQNIVEIHFHSHQLYSFVTVGWNRRNSKTH